MPVSNPPVTTRPVDAARFDKMRSRVLQRPGATPPYAVFVGDSTFAGMLSMGAGQNYTNARQNSLVQQLSVELTRRGIGAQHESWCGGRTYVGATVATEAPDYDPRCSSVGAGWTVAYNTLGTVRFNNSTTANPITVTPERAFDRIDVLFARNPGQGTATINVDGGASLATIDANASSALGKQTVSCALGLHAINLARASGAFSPIGLVPWQSTARELVLLNVAAGGSTTASHSGVSAQWEFIGSCTWLQQALTVVSLGINDMLQDLVFATTRANLAAIVAAASAVGAVVMVTPPPLAEASASVSLAKQNAIEQAYHEIAAQYGARLVVSADVFGRDVAASITAGMMYSDGTHPTPIGLGVWTQNIASAILA